MDLSLLFHYLLIGGTAAIGLLVVAFLFWKIKLVSIAHEIKASQIAGAIAHGAMTFLWEEYKVIAFVAAPVALVVVYLLGWLAGLLFIIGACFSMLVGLIGMRAATAANVRTTILAKEKGEMAAFFEAYFGGGVMGFAVASFGLIGLLALFAIFFSWKSLPEFLRLITAFSFGASLIAFFARVGGGIYTKSADVGADLVGKIEAGIPEDDPRNPAVIADNVGDCVGDTAGMGADIYESYVSAMVSTVIVASTKYGAQWMYLLLPVMISVFGLLGSVGAIVMSSYLRFAPAVMLRVATWAAILFSLVISWGYMYFMGIEMNLFIAIVLGCVAGIIVGLITEYYTAGKPVRDVANACQSGAATNIIYGFSVGMESTVAPTIILSLIVLAAHTYGGGLFGVALAAVSMLSTVGITMTVDAYGPIADNAGGIAEMSGFGKPVRDITDKLDSLGNTTAAMGKGFAIGSALLAALSLFAAYASEAHLEHLDLVNVLVISGMFIGAALPFLISALTMRSVSRAAWQMVMEVRRQFKTIPGLLAGTGEPDYERCIMISTRASLKEMILPGILTVLAPILTFILLGKEALGGFLVGATLVGVFLALMMANGGGVWDNAKKYIEAGNLGGKGSDAHKAAVIGDTVGDPFKDTSGPTLNILIKLMSIISLLLVLS